MLRIRKIHLLQKMKTQIPRGLCERAVGREHGRRGEVKVPEGSLQAMCTDGAEAVGGGMGSMGQVMEMSAEENLE